MRRGTVRQDYDRVQLVVDGKLIADMPWQKALALADAIRAQAKRAEEWANAEAIAMDHAILLRAGFPIGLTNHPTIQAEAAKIAAWDSDLRRYMPGGIKSQEQVGTPAIIQHSPR
jgi:hypothetical protein